MDANDLAKRLGWCGCGNPEILAQAMHQYLKLVADKEHKWSDYEAQFPDDLAREFVMHNAANAKLTEHGGSVVGSWLTDDGRKAIQIWDERGYEDWAWEPA